MSKPLRIVLLLVLAAAVGGGVWWYAHRPKPDDLLVLYGNVDLRQAALPFDDSGRIAEVLVEEGARVRKGQILARLDVSRLKPQVAQAEAAVAAQRAALLQLRNGSRPEEIEQERANLESAKADAANAQAQYARRRALVASSAVSRQDLDIARATAEMAAAKVKVSESALALALAGPRTEEILQAEAQLRGSEAELELMRQQLVDAELLAPFDAVVRSRLMEPGEMASPTRPVFSLARTGTKWVRAYVSERGLGHVRPGMKARIITDSFPDRPLEGWVGFISPVAEFTPKTVQTEDLRSSLVYEVRVFAEDPGDLLRVGMPATVQLLPDAAPAGQDAAAAPP